MTKVENTQTAHYLLPVSVEFKASPEIQELRQKLLKKVELKESTLERLRRSNLSVSTVRAANERRRKQIADWDRSIESVIRRIKYADFMMKLENGEQLRVPDFYPSDEDVEKVKAQVEKRRLHQRIIKSSQSLR